MKRYSVVALVALVIPGSALHAQNGMSAGTLRDPAYATDGRLAVSLRGDLWVMAANGSWSRLTSGPGTDREPAWAADGRSIIFASDRAGSFDLWRVALDANGAAGEPVRLTTTVDDEREPAVAGERVLFVRGRGSAARLWVRDPSGAARRLTRGSAGERWPAVSPDGRRVAYVVMGETSRRLVMRAVDGGGVDSTVTTGGAIEHPAWSPDGMRIAYTTPGFRAGVFVVPLDGRYTNLVAARHAAPAWSPDGRRVALAALPDDDVGYNGDPDRLGDRDARDLLSAAGALRIVDAPAPPDSGSALTAAALTPADRAAYNAAAFDQLWERTARLYYAEPAAADRRARWETLRARYRPRALAATTDDGLRAVLHEMLREHPPYRAAAAGRAAVSSAHPVATAAGLEILRRGGNVVDAAAAVSFALGVVEPDASGPGGYGEMLVYRSSMGAPALIEFMSRVPEDAGLGNAEIAPGGRLPDDGPVLANVPGTVAAMHLAFTRYGSGKVTWAEVLDPAIRAARDGYVVSEGLATTLATEREHFLKYDGSRALFFRDGQPLRAGDTLRNPDLAWTLEQIARGGANAFYKGEIARRLVADLRGKGNAMKASDLARYYAAEREPVSGTYRGYTLYASAPPVAGGAQLVGTLNLLEQLREPKAYSEDASTLHAMLSAWLLTPSSRNRIADPGLWPVNTAPITSKDTALARWRCFDPAKALAAELLRGDSLPCAATPPTTEHPDSHHASGTTAFVVADADGNVVAATQTLGTWGGNFYVTPGLGFLYNDKLGSYPTEPSSFGARLPFARHGSTITPTIVFRAAPNGGKPRPVAALGAAGNAWITAAVYQTLVGLLDQHLDPQAALELPRFLVGGRSATGNGITVQMEDGFAPSVIARLESLGYRPQIVSLMGELREGYGAALTIEGGKVTAGADPRRAGGAGAVP